MLRIRLFGQLRLSAGDRPLKFSGPPKTLPLLAFLLLRRAAPVSRERLAALLWPDDPEREARSNLRRHLYHLQRALPAAPPDQSWLLAEGNELQWNPAGDWWLDVADFERQIGAAGLQEEAVALYTDDLLPDLYDDWIIAERERLRDLLFRGLLQLVRRQSAAGAHGQAAAYARLLLGRDPLHEEALRELVAVLALSGERALALQEYRRFERRLREELGVDPMPETVAVYQAVGRSEPPAREAGAAPAARPAAAPAANLPTQLTGFVGRREELAEVRRLIRPPEGPARLLTLTGPGGSGKTRLAVEAAGRLARLEPELFPEGVFFVSLADINDPALVASAVAAQLGIKESGLTAEDALKQGLRLARTLVVLDNFEQVVEAAPLLAELLASAPGLRLIVTSRAVLRLYGEVEFPVPPLPLPDLARLPPPDELLNYAAVALFVERARAVNRRFALTDDNAAQVAEICVRLDGLPLALELAAARSKVFTPAAMLARLASRLEFLTGQTRSVAARQQTLRLAIDWSYNLLAPPEQAAFARLGTLVGAFTLEAAEHVIQEQGGASEAGPLDDLIAALVDQSMLRPEPAASPGGEQRFRMLLTLREYALAQLEARGERAAWQARHARYYLARAEQAGPALIGPDQADWVQSLEADHDNLRAALAWALENQEDGDLGLPAFAALGHFWYLRSHLAEGRRWLTAAVERWPAANPALRAETLRAAGVLALTQGENAAAETLLTQAVELWRAAGPAHQLDLARTLRNLGLVAWACGELARADQYHQESLALARAAGDPQHIANMLNTLGLVANAQGDNTRALAYYGEALASARRAGDLLCMANVINNLGIVAYETGDFSLARERLREALDMFRQLGHLQGVAIALNNLGNAHRIANDLAGAAACYRESIEADREHGNEAHTAYPLFGLGAVAHRQGNAPLAREYFERSLAVRRRFGDRRGLAQCLDGLAWVLSAQGHAERAARLWGAAEAARQALGEPPHPVDIRFEHQAAVAQARAALPGLAFKAAWQAGRALTLDEAVALAGSPA